MACDLVLSISTIVTVTTQLRLPTAISFPFSQWLLSRLFFARPDIVRLILTSDPACETAETTQLPLTCDRKRRASNTGTADETSFPAPPR